MSRLKTGNGCLTLRGLSATAEMTHQPSRMMEEEERTVEKTMLCREKAAG